MMMWSSIAPIARRSAFAARGVTRIPSQTTHQSLRALCGSSARFSGSDDRPAGASPSTSSSFVDRVVDKLNASIKAHPAETLAVLFASDIGSIGAMYGLLSLSGETLALPSPRGIEALTWSL